MKNKTKSTHSKNLLQFTITDEAKSVLDSFTKKYGSSKSYVINKALILLGAQYHHKIIISYEIARDDDTTTTTTHNETLYEKTVRKHREKYEDQNAPIPEDEWNQIMNDMNKGFETYKKNH